MSEHLDVYEGRWVAVDECDGCGYGPTRAVASNAHHRKAKGLPDLMLCAVCLSTPVGTAALYDTDDSRANGTILRSVAHCTNMILAAMLNEQGGGA